MKILVVDDDEATREVVREILEEENYPVVCASSGEEALCKLEEDSFPIILTDLKMDRLDGIKLLGSIKKLYPQSVIILMTAFGSVETTVEAIRNGAFDYISKPFRVDYLKSLISRAAQHADTLAKTKFQAKTDPGPASVRTLIGKSPQMVEVYKTVGRAALSESNVLILGESGTGKEVIARLIHENSRRKTKLFVPINCGALSENLLESELFGHVKGSFTGALANKRGLFEEANEGTLFLDEIGDMPLSLQVKLLRTLQDGEIRPVGGHECHKVNVRVMAATHKNLDALVKEKIFREDLYYRLRVITMTLPPLRERTGDLPELVNHFVAKHSEKSQKNISHVSDEAMEELTSYHWPGNIRELENAIERAVALASTTILFLEDFPPEISHKISPVLKASESEKQRSSPPARSLNDVEKEHILTILKEVNYNKVEAAKILRIGRVTLYRKSKLYGINLDGRHVTHST